MRKPNISRKALSQEGLEVTQFKFVSPLHVFQVVQGFFLHKSNILIINTLSKIVHLQFFNKQIKPEMLMPDYLFIHI